MARRVSVADELVRVHEELGDLDGAAAGGEAHDAVAVGMILPVGMGEVDDEGAVAADDHVGVLADRSVVVARPRLRKDLEELVGPVEKPTQIADLDVKRIEPPKQAAKGVVPRLRLPGRLSPVRGDRDRSDARARGLNPGHHGWS